MDEFDELNKVKKFTNISLGRNICFIGSSAKIIDKYRMKGLVRGCNVILDKLNFG